MGNWIKFKNNICFPRHNLIKIITCSPLQICRGVGEGRGGGVGFPFTDLSRSGGASERSGFNQIVSEIAVYLSTFCGHLCLHVLYHLDYNVSQGTRRNPSYLRRCGYVCHESLMHFPLSYQIHPTLYKCVLVHHPTKTQLKYMTIHQLTVYLIQAVF